VIIALIATQPRLALVVMAYSYTLFAIVVWVIGRVHKRHHDEEPTPQSDSG
jgi:hypothetical protein